MLLGVFGSCPTRIAMCSNCTVDWTDGVAFRLTWVCLQIMCVDIVGLVTSRGAPRWVDDKSARTDNNPGSACNMPESTINYPSCTSIHGRTVCAKCYHVCDSCS